MSDPRSSFYAGLARFKQRQAYANIVFDRSVPYWTAAFSAKDPFTDLTKVQLQHDAAFDDVVLETHDLVLPRDRAMQVKPRTAPRHETDMSAWPLQLGTKFLVKPDLR